MLKNEDVKLLAIDTCVKEASVSIFSDNQIFTLSDDANITHSEKVLPLIDKSLKNLKLNISDITMLGVLNGPGSFTGSRIGVSTIKALAFNRNLPIISMTSLLSMAIMKYITCAESKKEITICSMLDARNDRCYFAIYTLSTNTKGNLIIKNIYDVSNDEFANVKKICQDIDVDFFVIDNSSSAISYFDNIETMLPSPESIIYLYNHLSKKELEGYMKNTFSLDVVYARMSQAERLKSGV